MCSYYLLRFRTEQADSSFWVFVLLSVSRMVPFLPSSFKNNTSSSRPGTRPSLPQGWSENHHPLQHVFLLNTYASTLCSLLVIFLNCYLIFWLMVNSFRSDCKIARRQRPHLYSSLKHIRRLLETLDGWIDGWMGTSVGLFVIWVGTINLAQAIYMRRIPPSIYHRGLGIEVKEQYLDPEPMMPLRGRGNETGGDTTSQ